jgi:hypothetical protein
MTGHTVWNGTYGVSDCAWWCQLTSFLDPGVGVSRRWEMGENFPRTKGWSMISYTTFNGMQFSGPTSLLIRIVAFESAEHRILHHVAPSS